MPSRRRPIVGSETDVATDNAPAIRPRYSRLTAANSVLPLAISQFARICQEQDPSSELPTDYEQLSDTGRPTSCYYQVFPKAGPSPSNDRKKKFCGQSTDFPVEPGTISTYYTVTRDKLPRPSFQLRAIVRHRFRDPVLFTCNLATQPESVKRWKRKRKPLRC